MTPGRLAALQSGDEITAGSNKRSPFDSVPRSLWGGYGDGCWERRREGCRDTDAGMDAVVVGSVGLGGIDESDHAGESRPAADPVGRRPHEGKPELRQVPPAAWGFSGVEARRAPSSVRFSIS